MRLALPAAMLCLLAAAPAAPAAVAPIAKAKLTGCDAALTDGARRASFEGDMRGIPGATRLQMKFVLKVRSSGRPRWMTVDAAGFGVWSSSAAGIGRYVYTKRVENLPAPGAYRATVRFRWLSAAGRVLQRASRHTRACRQPDMRPDLVPLRFLDVGPGATAETRRYAVVVRNAGRTPAGPFAVAVAVGGRTLQLGALTALAPGQEMRLEGDGPVCPENELARAIVDSGAAVDESDEEANAFFVACPVPSAA